MSLRRGRYGKDRAGKGSLYEWDIPETMKEFAKSLTVNKNACIFMVATYVAIHGRCFETMDKIFREKGARLDYGKLLRCVASQCIAYGPFPFPKLMVPHSDCITSDAV